VTCTGSGGRDAAFGVSRHPVASNPPTAIGRPSDARTANASRCRHRQIGAAMALRSRYDLPASPTICLVAHAGGRLVTAPSAATVPTVRSRVPADEGLARRGRVRDRVRQPV